MLLFITLNVNILFSLSTGKKELKLEISSEDAGVSTPSTLGKICKLFLLYMGCRVRRGQAE